MKDDKKEESFKEILERAKKECSAEDVLKTGITGFYPGGGITRSKCRGLIPISPLDRSRLSNMLMKTYGITGTPPENERRFGFSKEEGFGITKWSYVVPTLPEGTVIVTEELDPSDDSFVFVFVKEQNKPECEVYVCNRNTGVIVYHQSLNEMVVERGKSPSFLKWYYAMIEYKHKLFAQHFLSWGMS